MHIIGIIVTLLAGAGFWFWRARAAAQAVSELGDAAGRLRGKVKRTMFRRKVEGATLTGIDDPRLGAAVLLVSFVEVDRRITPADEASIGHWLRREAGEDKPEEAIVFARWACREVVDLNEVLRRLTPLFRERLGPDERAALVEKAASLISPRSDAPGQNEALRRMRVALTPERIADAGR